LISSRSVDEPSAFHYLDRPHPLAKAMGRLDAVLGRSPLDAPEPNPDEPIQSVLWLDEDPEAGAGSNTAGDGWL
jgi:hypothetical protein